MVELIECGAMGSALPVAIGVQVARPEAVVVLVIGEGEFLVHSCELQVLAEYELPVVCVVLNSAAAEIDAAKIAEAFGCTGYRVHTSSELARTLDEVVAKRRPAVIDVEVTHALRGGSAHDLTVSLSSPRISATTSLGSGNQRNSSKSVVVTGSITFDVRSSTVAAAITCCASVM